MSDFCWEIFLLQIHFLTFKYVVFHRQIPQTARMSQVVRAENGKRSGAHGWFSKFNVVQTDRGFDTAGAFFSPWVETLSSRPHANFGVVDSSLFWDARVSIICQLPFFLVCQLICAATEAKDRHIHYEKTSYKVRRFCLVPCLIIRDCMWLLCITILQKIQYLGNNRY